MPLYQITVRHGTRSKRYHMVQIEAADLAEALARAAASLPPEVRDAADLAEVRPAPEPDEERPWLGQDPE